MTTQDYREKSALTIFLSYFRNHRRLFAVDVTCAVGIALTVDGLENAWITAYTVRVRARKKHLSEHFGLEDKDEADR